MRPPGSRWRRHARKFRPTTERWGPSTGGDSMDVDSACLMPVRPVALENDEVVVRPLQRLSCEVRSPNLVTICSGKSRASGGRQNSVGRARTTNFVDGFQRKFRLMGALRPQSFRVMRGARETAVGSSECLVGRGARGFKHWRPASHLARNQLLQRLGRPAILVRNDAAELQ